VLGKTRNREHPSGRAERDDQPLVVDLDRAQLGVQGHGPGDVVQRDCSASHGLGLGALGAQRYNDAAGFDCSRRDFWQQRREEHGTLGVDDRGARLAEQSSHVRAPNPPPRISVPFLAVRRTRLRFGAAVGAVVMIIGVASAHMSRRRWR
jgi:hypothetical protein